MSWIRIPNCFAVSVAILASLGVGFASADTQPTPLTEPNGGIGALPQRPPAVNRQGRFALVEMQARTGERDLLQQVVETAVPDAVHATVGDGLRHLLARSGYRLCESAEAATLYGLPLPAAHLHLGPLTLRDALATMAGPAWTLSVDEVSRIVCFARSATPGNAAPQESIEYHPVRQP